MLGKSQQTAGDGNNCIHVDVLWRWSEITDHLHKGRELPGMGALATFLCQWVCHEVRVPMGG